MTPPPAVINTNVVISGLVGRESGSPTTVILDAMLGGLFTYLLSLDLLAEYHEVLLRPAIRRRHGLTDAEVDVVLTELALNGTLLDAAPPPPRCPTTATATCGLCWRPPPPRSWSRATMCCGGALPIRRGWPLLRCPPARHRPPARNCSA